VKRLATAIALLVVFSLSAAEPVELHLTSINTCGSCRNALFGDFNGDGLDDVLVQDQMQFNSGGAFREPITVAQLHPAGGDSAAAGNFNGDAFADLLVRNEGQLDRVLLGNGFGSFTERHVPNQYGSMVYVVDFSGDGLTDLITWKRGQFAFLRARGDGTFVLHQTFASGDSIRIHSVTPADVNGDGRRDLIMPAEDALIFYMAQPDGTFIVQERFTRVDPWAVTTGDLNGDGHLDLAFAALYQGQHGISVLFGDGAGSFPAAARMSIPRAEHARKDTDVKDIAIGDFVPGGAEELTYARMDGLIVTLTGLDNQLREVAREQANGMDVALYKLRFRDSKQGDLIAAGRVLSKTFAWFVDLEGAIAPRAPGGRMRSVNRAPDLTGTYDISIESDCPIVGLDSFSFVREGMFLHFAPSPALAAVRAVYLGGEIWVELHVKEGATTRVLSGELTPTRTGLAGKLMEWGDSPCGSWEAHRFEARKQ
jgi:hypothetical protein